MTIRRRHRKNDHQKSPRTRSDVQPAVRGSMVVALRNGELALRVARVMSDRGYDVLHIDDAKSLTAYLDELVDGKRPLPDGLVWDEQLASLASFDALWRAWLQGGRPAVVLVGERIAEAGVLHPFSGQTPGLAYVAPNDAAIGVAMFELLDFSLAPSGLGGAQAV